MSKFIACINCSDFRKLIDSTKMICSTPTAILHSNTWTEYIVFGFSKNERSISAFSCNGASLSYQSCEAIEVKEDLRAMVRPNIDVPDSPSMLSILIEDEYLVFKYEDKVLKVKQPVTLLNNLPDVQTIIHAQHENEPIEVRVDADLLHKAISSQKKRFKSKRKYRRRELLIQVSQNPYKPIVISSEDKQSFAMVMPLRKNFHGETI